MDSSIVSASATANLQGKDSGRGCEIKRASMDIGSHDGAMMDYREELNVVLGSTGKGMLAEI